MVVYILPPGNFKAVFGPPQATFELAGPSVKRHAANSPASLQQQAEHHVSTKKAAVRLFQQLQVHQQVTWQAAPAAAACPAGISAPQTAAVSGPLQGQGPSLKPAPQQSGRSIGVSGVTLHRSVGQQLQHQHETNVSQQQLPQQPPQLCRQENPNTVQTRQQQYAQPSTDMHCYQQHTDSCAKLHQIEQHQHTRQHVHHQPGQEANFQQQSKLDKPLLQCKQQHPPGLQLQPPSASAPWKPQQVHPNHDHQQQHQHQQQKIYNQTCPQQPAKLPDTADQQQGMQHLHAYHLHTANEQLQVGAEPSRSRPARMCHSILQLELPRAASAPTGSSGSNIQQLSDTAACGHSWGTAVANSGQGKGAAAAFSGMATSNASGGGASGRQRSVSQPVNGCHTRPNGNMHAGVAGAGSTATWVVQQHVQPPAAQQQQQQVHHPLARQQRQPQQYSVPHQQQQQQQQVQHVQLQQHQVGQPQQQQQPPLDVKQELQAPAVVSHTASSNSTHVNGHCSSSRLGDNHSGPSAAAGLAVAPCAATTTAGGNDTNILPDALTAAATAAAAVSATSNESSGMSGRRKLPPSFQGAKGLSGARQQQRRQQPGLVGPAQQHQQQQQVVPHGKPQKLLEFQGVVRYAYNPMEVDWLCRQMLDAGPPKIIGRLSA